MLALTAADSSAVAVRHCLPLLLVLVLVLEQVAEVHAHKKEK
jgi:hypothetical protein